VLEEEHDQEAADSAQLVSSDRKREVIVKKIILV